MVDPRRRRRSLRFAKLATPYLQFVGKRQKKLKVGRAVCDSDHTKANRPKLEGIGHKHEKNRPKLEGIGLVKKETDRSSKGLVEYLR